MDWTPISGFAHRDSVINGRHRLLIPLSPAPPPEWVDFFNDPRGIQWPAGRQPQHLPRIEPGRSNVVIDQEAIEVDGKAHQLACVQQLISYANQRYQRQILHA